MRSSTSSARAKASAAASSPKNFKLAGFGMPRRSSGGGPDKAPNSNGREKGSSESYPAMISKTCQASSTVPAKTETQSSERHAGTTPRVETAPQDGFKPTILLRPAGTRPEPAV